jgi:hypothetical protein
MTSNSFWGDNPYDASHGRRGPVPARSTAMPNALIRVSIGTSSEGPTVLTTSRPRPAPRCPR